MRTTIELLLVLTLLFCPMSKIKMRADIHKNLWSVRVLVSMFPGVVFTICAVSASKVFPANRETQTHFISSPLTPGSRKAKVKLYDVSKTSGNLFTALKGWTLQNSCLPAWQHQWWWGLTFGVHMALQKPKRQAGMTCNAPFCDHFCQARQFLRTNFNVTPDKFWLESK